MTKTAVLSSLTMLYLNGFRWPYKDVIVAIAALLNITAIGWGITFVVRIIGPDKYTNAAKRLLEEERQRWSLPASRKTQRTFSRSSSD